MTDADRSIEVELEVPGTPEQVWEAIATGPGLSAWFVPAEVDEHAGGTIRTHHGMGADGEGAITAYDRPHRFAWEDEWPMPGDAPPRRLATEFLVEARAGGSCVVRIVASGFGHGDDWDEQIGRVRRGWSWCLQALRLILSDFPGRHCSVAFAAATTRGPREPVWRQLTEALGLADAAEGERSAPSAPGAPALDGRVLWREDDMAVLRLDAPAPGVAYVMAHGDGDVVHTRLHAAFFADDAPALAAREQPSWESWLNMRFPAPDSRLVAAEAELPGTPEEIWETIATGPGIACWFTPAEVAPHVGGEVVMRFGAFGESRGVVCAWQPPHRIAFDERGWAEGAPPWATELLVEARAGGTSVIRLVSGIFARGDDWADEIGSSESGWTQALDNLRLYLTHFKGLPVGSLFCVGQVPASDERAWPELLAALGLAGAQPGDAVTAPPDAPALAGVVEQRRDDVVLVRAHEPAPGLVALATWRSGDAITLTARAYLYGDRAAAIAAGEEPAWSAWLGERSALLAPPADGAVDVTRV